MSEHPYGTVLQDPEDGEVVMVVGGGGAWAHNVITLAWDVEDNNEVVPRDTEGWVVCEV